jgi:hypothetical protein
MAVPKTISRALQQIEKETGYIGFFCFAGPEPQRGGSLQVMT